MKIISHQNHKIKNLIKLIKKSRIRKKQECFVVEGFKENQIAIQNNFKVIEFYICPLIFKFNFLNQLKKFTINVVDKSIYKKISFRKTTEGIIGLYKMNLFNKINFILSNNPTVLIAESIEKPGNLGAILRICDNFLVDLFILCNSKIDIFNPNVIRSSLGSIFTVPIIQMTQIECLNFCLKNKLKICTTFVEENFNVFHPKNLNYPIAIIFGNENKGVSLFWKKYSKENYTIPMLGKINSLNVSNSVAIILHQILIQKNSIS